LPPLLLVALLPLPRDREQAVLDLDLEVVGLHARYVRTDDELAIRAHDVDCRQSTALAAEPAIESIVDSLIELGEWDWVRKR
jgi:hypothetical protein